MTPVEGFRKCPTPGCSVSVWGPTNTENYCRLHGGNVLGFPEVDEDEWGEPHMAAADVSSTPAARPFLEDGG